ncbi:exportin, putative, partial [Eimeria maxima]
DERNFVLTVIENHTQQTDVLDEKQQLLFFEAVGHIISATPPGVQNDCIAALMGNCLKSWGEIINKGKNNAETLFSVQSAKQLVHIIRISQRIAKETLHLLEVYADEALRDGQSPAKKETVKELVGQVLQPILQDYRDNTPDSRDCEVLALLAVLMARLDTHISSVLPVIFDYIFDCTLQMIKSDFQSYPDHRERFYALLKACNQHCFEGLFSLPSQQLKAFVESLEEGLQVTYEFLQKLIDGKRELLSDFCSTYYFSLMKEILLVLTDRLHRSGFKYQTLIFMSLLRIVGFGLVRDEANGLTQENVTKSLIELLSRSFQTLNHKQVEAFVVDLFNFCGDSTPSRFQQHMRDFLISLKEFAGDNDALFEAEREEALERARELEKKKRGQVPGMTPQYESMVSIHNMED